MQFLNVKTQLFNYIFDKRTTRKLLSETLNSSSQVTITFCWNLSQQAEVVLIDPANNGFYFVSYFRFGFLFHEPIGQEKKLSLSIDKISPCTALSLSSFSRFSCFGVFFVSLLNQNKSSSRHETCAVSQLVASVCSVIISF